ncbi:hypothetical protein Hanom_Chr10g00934591 [Helianthus anomalus]
MPCRVLLKFQCFIMISILRLFFFLMFFFRRECGFCELVHHLIQCKIIYVWILRIVTNEPPNFIHFI